MELGPVTARQQTVLDFIAEACEQGRPPTLREIGKAFGIKSPNGVHCHLRSLIRKKAVVAFGKGSRCYRPVPSPAPQVAAGADGEIMLRFPGRMVARLTPAEALQLEADLAAARKRKSA